jgi:hypothetical protein
MQIAIYDMDESYAQRLAQFILYQEDWAFVAAFTEKEQLLEHCRQEKPQLLLVAEELWEESLLPLSEKRILLSEREESEEGDLPKICRYQAADELLREVHFLCGDDRNEKKKREKKAEIYCVYSPSGHPRQSLFAWNLAKVLNQGNTLYLNLQENSGFEELFSREYKRNLSDLLYLWRHRKDDFAELVKAIACEEDGLTYLPPMQNSADAFLMEGREWEEFFEELRSACGFSFIVADVGVIFPGFWQFLQKSSYLYEPVLSFEYARIRQREFDRLLEWKYPLLTKSVRRIQLPADREMLREHSSLTQPEMQDFVRMLLEKEVAEDGTCTAEAENSGGGSGRGRVIS